MAQFYPTKRKLIYCSRTVPEIEKALAELKRLMEYRLEMGAKDEEFRGMGLTSRRNLCLHPEVSSHDSCFHIVVMATHEINSCYE
jgi:DNA excision repair protein ERCC-2